MLVRVRGTTERSDNTFKLNLALPVLYLDDTNYTVALRSILLDCSEADYVPNFWSLQTTAIDKCATNPRQELATFKSQCNPELSDCLIYYEPTQKQEYKLQLTSLHTAEFALVALKQDLYLHIEAVEILLEFQRYARI